MEKINASMIRHAWQVAEEIEANAALYARIKRPLQIE